MSSDATSTIPLIDGFAFHSSTTASPRLLAAFARYEAILKASGAYAPRGADGLATVDVSIDSDDETLFFGVDESYELSVAERTGTASIRAATVYGAIHGLETFVQLADEYGPVAQQHLSVPASLHMQDAPRFAWRGLMIDTARHFYPLPFLKHIVDAMTASKLNVLHVHFTDDQSFPVESERWPKLSGEGAFRDPLVDNILERGAAWRPWPASEATRLGLRDLGP